MNLLFTLWCLLFSLCSLPLRFFPFELMAFSRCFLSLITEYIPASLSWLCRWNLCHHQSSPTCTQRSSPPKKKASKISDFFKNKAMTPIFLFSRACFSSESGSHLGTWPTCQHSCLQTPFKPSPSCSKPLQQFAMAAVAVSALQNLNLCKITVQKLWSFSSTRIHQFPSSCLVSSFLVLEIMKTHLLFLPFRKLPLNPLNFGPFVRERAGSSGHDLMPIRSLLNLECTAHPGCGVPSAAAGERTRRYAWWASASSVFPLQRSRPVLPRPARSLWTFKATAVK